MQIAILGAGMVGRAMAIDLAAKYNVTSFDVSDNALQLLSQKNNTIKKILADGVPMAASRFALLLPIIQRVVIPAVPL